MENRFAYTDEQDKSYGLTGMVISLELLDEENKLQRVTLDETEGDSISFTPDFWFCGNPRFSAKTAWNETLRQYQLMTGMIIGNIMCRYTVLRHKPLDRDTVDAIHALVEDEGRDMCQLEKDETDMLFEKTMRYMANVYNDMRMHRLASGLAAALIERRTLSGNEILEEIQLLRRR